MYVLGEGGGGQSSLGQSCIAFASFLRSEVLCLCLCAQPTSFFAWSKVPKSLQNLLLNINIRAQPNTYDLASRYNPTPPSFTRIYPFQTFQAIPPMPRTHDLKIEWHHDVVIANAS